MKTWGSLLTRQGVAVIECRGTGLGGSAEVVEIAAVDTGGCALLNRLVMPAGDWGSAAGKAERFHGLPLERLMQDGVPWIGVHEEVELLLREAPVVAGWSIRPDVRLMRQSARVWDLELPDVRAAHDVWRAADRGGVRRTRGAGGGRALAGALEVLGLMRAHPGVEVDDLG